MTDREMISLAASRGWRIEKTREGKVTWFRGVYHDGRMTQCPTQSLASTMRLIQVAHMRGVRMSVEEAQAWMDRLIGVNDLDTLLFVSGTDYLEGDRLAESYRSAEAYTVLSAANMPEARAYFGAMFNPKEARP